MKWEAIHIIISITIIIINIMIIITFLQGVYNYVGETNRMCKVHFVATVL
jgi:hypothetical protein